MSGMSINNDHLFKFILVSCSLLLLIAQVNAAEALSLPYHASINFQGETREYSLDQAEPPFSIAYTVTPVMESGTKTDCQNADCSNYKLVPYTRVSSKSWFLVTVKNSKTSSTLLDDGFGNANDQNSQKKITIREPGPYTITVSGKFVTVSLDITSPTSSSKSIPEQSTRSATAPEVAVTSTTRSVMPGTTASLPSLTTMLSPASLWIWDRTFLSGVILLLSSFLSVALCYDIYFKKRVK
jgi:hypothetical protein